jgi:hypothetical protein
MRTTVATTLTLSILPLLLLASTGRAAVVPFTDTYAAHHIDHTVSDCRTTLPLTGLEPSDPGHPVFVYLVGAGEPYDGAEAPAILHAAAAKGFVAASVAYPQWQLYAKGIDGMSRCVFNPWSPSSAISKLCSRPTANCWKGVVVAGFSQGGVIAMRAANHEWRVRAAYLLSVIEERMGWEGTARWQLATTWPTGTRALPNGAIRIVDGVSEVPPDRRDELNDLTGKQCAVTAFSCLASNGSGWYVVQNSEVANGKADHCYFMGADGYTSCSPNPPFDRTWLTSATAPWALGPSLDWLWGRTG